MDTLEAEWSGKRDSRSFKFIPRRMWLSWGKKGPKVSSTLQSLAVR